MYWLITLLWLITLSYDIIYCPSCSTKKLDDDHFCSSCGFDFSVIKQKKISKGQFTNYLRIKDRGVFKYRKINFLDANNDLLLDFKSKFVMFGHKFEIYNSQSKFVYTLQTAQVISYISLFSPFDNLECTINFNNKTSTFNILDKVGKILYNYSCYFIHSGSFEVHNNITNDVIKFIKLDDDNPRTIKIVSTSEINKPLDQIFITALYFVLSQLEFLVLPLPDDEGPDVLT